MLKLLQQKVLKKSGHWCNLYQCDCVNQKIMFPANVRTGKSKSSGCLRSKVSRTKAKTHGLTGSYTYGIWAGMKGRCVVKNNAKYKTYGAVGITICEKWLKFEGFLEDMGEAPEGLTIDRIDGTKGYSKDNCRWATYQTQSRNRRVSSSSTTGVKGVSFVKSRNRYQARITVDGKTIGLGMYKKIEEAEQARIQAEYKYFGDIHGEK